LKEAKNYPYLLEVWEGLKDLNIQLDIYGAGPLQEKLQQVITARALKVRICGQVDDISQRLQQYDMFVQASAHEGFGISVIEAMSSGVPVVISDIPVFQEITSGHGHFFPLDNKQKAVAVLRKLAGSEAARKEHVQKAYEYCREHYSEQTYKANLLNIYNSAR
jgi:glycosyltransferase involved in cell wall biosynthesis